MTSQAFCSNCGSPRGDARFCPSCGTPAEGVKREQPKASFGRIIVTPIIVMAAGFLIGQVTLLLPALAIAALVSIAYVALASR